MTGLFQGVVHEEATDGWFTSLDAMLADLALSAMTKVPVGLSEAKKAEV